MESGIKWALGITGGVAVVGIGYYLWKRNSGGVATVPIFGSMPTSTTTPVIHTTPSQGNYESGGLPTSSPTGITTGVGNTIIPIPPPVVVQHTVSDMTSVVGHISKAQLLASSNMGAVVSQIGGATLAPMPITPTATQGTTGKPIMNQNITGDTYTTNVFNSNCKGLIASYNLAVNALLVNKASPDLFDITKRPGLISSVNKLAQQLKDAGCGSYTTY